MNVNGMMKFVVVSVIVLSFYSDVLAMESPLVFRLETMLVQPDISVDKGARKNIFISNKCKKLPNCSENTVKKHRAFLKKIVQESQQSEDFNNKCKMFEDTIPSHLHSSIIQGLDEEEKPWIEWVTLQIDETIRNAVVQRLVTQWNANLRTKNNKKQNILHVLASLSTDTSFKTIEWLINDGAEAWHKDENGNTPAHIAAKQTKNSLVFGYLQDRCAGASGKITNNNDETPEMLRNALKEIKK